MWPEAEKTQELLRAAKEGSPEAVNKLLARHRQALVRMVSLRLDRAIARREDASDIVQNVLIEVSARLKDYLKNPEMPFHLWIRHIAMDHMISAHRKHRVAQRRTVDKERSLAGPAYRDRSSVDLAAQLAAKGLTPAAAAIRKELEQRFAAALSELGEDDREIILMRHYEQLSNQEAAQALGLSQPAAAMRYLRALRRLRAVLGEEPGDSRG